MVKNTLLGDAGDCGFSLGSEDLAAIGTVQQLQYSWSAEFMDLGAWRTAVHGMQKSNMTEHAATERSLRGMGLCWRGRKQASGQETRLCTPPTSGCHPGPSTSFFSSSPSGCSQQGIQSNRQYAYVCGARTLGYADAQGKGPVGEVGRGGVRRVPQDLRQSGSRAGPHVGQGWHLPRPSALPLPLSMRLSWPVSWHPAGWAGSSGGSGRSLR